MPSVMAMAVAKTAEMRCYNNEETVSTRTRRCAIDLVEEYR